jgi:hypothetical protein
MTEMSEVNLSKVCRDFMKKKCEREDCRFIHDKKLCKRFHENWLKNGKGTCKYKDNCRKNHFVTVNENYYTRNKNNDNTRDNNSYNYNTSNNYNTRDNNSNYDNTRDNNSNNYNTSNNYNKRDNNYNTQKNGNSNNRNGTKKPRNTESWEPPHPPYDMRVQIETARDKSTLKYKPYDVVVAKSVFWEYKTLELHDKLVAEIEKCGELKEDLLKLWHGSEERGIKGTHHIANDRTNWKKECPTFELVINRLVEYFGVKPAATRFNWYKSYEEYKSFHFDSAYVNPEKAKTQNITIGVSFGQTRDIVFENAKSKQRVCIEQGDNDVYIFMNEINSTWRHGVSKGVPSSNSSRVSIIIWGWVDTEK